MKKYFIIAVSILVVVVAGYFSISRYMHTDETNGVATVMYPLEINKPRSGIPTIDERPIGMSAVYDAKIQIGSIQEAGPAKIDQRYYPGKAVNFKFTIWNGNTIPAQYRITFERPNPDNCYAGWKAAPEYVYRWLDFSDREPILEPRSEKEIKVTLCMPEDATVFADRWEFLIAVRDINPKKSVQEVNNIRVFVSMRD